MDQFSSDFAAHWDELVGWQKRSAIDVSFLVKLLKKFGCRSVLDVALGTGFHSIELLKAGFQVKSVDISAAMIEVAKKNAARNSVELSVVCTDWINLNSCFDEKFDCVLCLGNSLACEMDSEKRQKSVLNWTKLLTEKGIVIVDRRNYESLLAGRYQNNTKSQYFGETVKITHRKVTTEETVFSYTFSDGRTFDLRMYPILDEQIRSSFSSAGLIPVEFYGDRQPDNATSDVAFYSYVFGRNSHAEL